MRKFLLAAASAIAISAASPAIAQETTAPAPAAAQQSVTSGSDLGQFSSSAASGVDAAKLDGTTVVMEDGKSVGDISDVVVSTGGEVVGVVIGVSGKDVLVPMEKLEITELDQAKPKVVIKTSREELDSAPTFDRAAFEQQSTAAPDGPKLATDGASAGMDQQSSADTGIDQQSMTSSDASSTTGGAVTPQPESSDAAMSNNPAGTTSTDAAAPDAPAGDTAATDDGATSSSTATDIARSDDSTAMNTPPASTSSDQPAASTDSAATATPPVPSTDPAAPSDSTAATTAPSTTAPATDGEVVGELQGTGGTAMSASELIGDTVYTSGDENVGDINDVIVSDTGEIEGVVIGVGGFLGLGEKDVAVKMDGLSFVKDENGIEKIVVKATREELDAAPAFDRSTLRSEQPAPAAPAQ